MDNNVYDETKGDMCFFLMDLREDLKSYLIILIDDRQHAFRTMPEV